MKIFAETDRLILREIMPEDLDGMFELDSDPLVHKYLGNKPLTDKTASEKIIADIRSQYSDRGVGRWATIEKATGEFIGWSGLKLNTEMELNGQRNFYDVGYRFIPRYWGKGYATESAISALEYGFETLNLKTIVGVAEEGNVASNKILQKIGLQYKNHFPFEDLTAIWYELNKEDYGKSMS